MRFKNAPLFQMAACLAVLAFLFGVVAANAAGPDERVSRDPRQIHKPYHFKSFGTGKHEGSPSFLKSGDCESSCCYAWSTCDDGGAECSDEACSAWCGDLTVTYFCRAS